jgi:hypothetical protein
VFDSDGVRTIVRRHFIYIVRELEKQPINQKQPYLSILKTQDTKNKKQHFFCKLKGSVCASFNNKIYLIEFMHSLMINLTALPEGLVKYSIDSGEA